ncbi:L-ascorbate metabolism protein UlaG (beta-lactamase superfamily) [Streptosporangium becharense]|uniref:L-ascorbate metabolism protein UlaG (Beta-lactamase superfamily) n=1 Tax=Streptosporangium becharense TaxID=1816182 RepID=A0A7W9MIG1_9ACTN|nr:MBL fold metallo-hydrolase [Streptosporangium becharense]MBB2913909.1 L-ascorbate metabolism protein UlaG (beta-lactamase superfamily) [Streptosporangium becharense]MBB5821429.1 L-ascorbate metabolism protein UlaG (beta-lactamase superfamily) [Streptosporangium becharense]
MKLTKFGHACVRLEKGDSVLVIDPGSFSEESALDGARAVLITHEHFDHVEADRLRRAAEADPALEIWTNESVAATLPDVPATIRVVRDGDSFETAGFAVRTVGEWHAPNHPDMPIVSNVGFLVDEEVFYPGDALTPPGVEVPTLLVPTNAPWLKAYEMIEYLREIRPARAFSTHDGLLNDIGLGLVDRWLEMEAGKQKAEMRRLAPGESVTLP